MNGQSPGSTVALVAAGGAIGAMLRHGCSLAATTLGGGEVAWLLFVNLLGSFALGFVFVSLDPEAPRLRDVERSLDELDPDPRKDRIGAFLAVGLIGAFTTYSSLALLLMQRFEAGRILEGVLLLGVSLVGGVVMVASGVRFGRWRKIERQP